MTSVAEYRKRIACIAKAMGIGVEGNQLSQVVECAYATLGLESLKDEQDELFSQRVARVEAHLSLARLPAILQSSTQV